MTSFGGPGGPGGPGGVGWGGHRLSPSSVGGVYLGGAGGALNGFGVLKGVQLDANGNLILIGEDDANIELPSLRLDDMVTVFRSVYLHGEGPTVTIDPNPKDPENSAMIIRHSEATKQTYVGWILYQADRLMKGYGQGVDNITQKDIVSAVPGYADVLDTIYFGSSNPRQSQKKGNWERFWIVPAETNRFQCDRKKLTLFDVPLKLKTQKMKWVGDKLVDDVTGMSSPGANAFTKWFTSNYDGIATEQYLTPPAESGITKAVPVFAELQRVALMTAIAEKLRDQGVPMPFWMYDYKVPPVPFEKYTPGLEVTRTKQDGNIIRTARIFGGVTLSPDSKSVKTYSTSADAMTAPVRIRDKVNRSIKLADYLDGAVAAAITPVGTIPLMVQAIPHDNRIFKAASIPGANTQVLGPNRLEEVDVVIPVGRDRDIRLTRSFNSFFNPTGPWGQGWSLNLPRLVKARVVLDRKDGEVSYTTGHVLITPLNTLQAHFLNGIPVRSFANPKTPVRDPKSPFRRMAIARPTFLKIDSTRVLKLKNGQEWHFSENGALVAVKDGPQVTVYERGAAGQVTRIVGLLGGQLAGEIKLEYAGDEKLKMAIGRSFDNQQSKSLTVTYDYDDAGRLITVKSEEGKIGYGYDGTRVSAVTWQDKAGGSQPEVLRSFRYNDQGQVLSQNNGSATIVHTISLEPGGVVASSHVEQGGEKEDTAETVVTHYDYQMRPIKAVAADGTSTDWFYPAMGGMEMTVTSPDHQSLKIIDSPDGSKRTLERNGVPWLTAEFDEGGHMVNMSEHGHSVVTQEWRPDGQIARTETVDQDTFFRYSSQGLLSSFIIHPAQAGNRPTEWQETRLDRNGRPQEITDNTGVRIQMTYDESGNLTAAVQKAPDGKGNLGYNIERNSQGRVEAVNSSWGNTEYTYDQDGSLQNVNATRGEQSANIKFVDGRVLTMTGFDNGQTSFAYYNDGPATGMPRSIVQPNGLKLEYNYNTDGRLSAVKVGTDRRVKLEYDPQGRMATYAWEEVKR